MQKVFVMGQGYVGLTVAVQAAEAGFDVEAGRVKRVHALGGRYRASADRPIFAGFYERDLGAKPLHEGVPGLSYLESAAARVASRVTGGCTVVLESQTYPGSTEELVAPVLEAASGVTVGVEFHLGCSPGRSDPGNEVWTFERTPKVVSGVSPASLLAVQGFYDHLVDMTVPVSSPREAELAKLLEKHLPPRQHGTGQRARHVRSRPGYRRVGGHRPRLHQTVRVHAVHPGAGGWGSLPAYRPNIPIVAGKAVTRPVVPVRRARHDVKEHMPEYVVTRLVTALNKSVPSRDVECFCSGWRTRRTRATLASRPSVAIAARLLALGARPGCGSARDGFPDPNRHDASGPRRHRSSSSADALLLLFDHHEFDLGLVRSEAT